MNLQQQLGEWYPLLSHVFDTDWFQKLGRRLGAAKCIQPQLENLFRAFRLCPPSKVKVVIIGQDPYINGEADGLAFSSYGKMTPSLEVVFEEINRTHTCMRTQTHLDDWAVQGVFLLNSVLTTEMGQSKAHHAWGWENFIQETIKVVNRLPQPIVYLLWGRDAQAIMGCVNTMGQVSKQGHCPRLILKTYHPQAQNYSPSNKFVGCNHFNDANLFLLKHGIKPIWWTDPMYDPDAPTWFNYLEHLKLLSHAEIDISKVMHSYPAVPDQPHPFAKGLQPEHNDTLPF